GLLARRSAGAWQILPTNTDEELYDADGLDDAVWIVGNQGVAFRWDGRELTPDGSFLRQSNLALEIFAADDIWVGGFSLDRFDGERWTEDKTLGLGACIDIHAFAPTDVWCVSDLGELYRWDGERWFAVVEGGGLVRYRSHDELDQPRMYADGRRSARFVGRALDDLYVAGDRSVLHWDGSTWRDHARLPKWMNAATVLESGSVLAVGEGGRVVSVRGSSPAATPAG